MSNNVEGKTQTFNKYINAVSTALNHYLNCPRCNSEDLEFVTLSGKNVENGQYCRSCHTCKDAVYLLEQMVYRVCILFEMLENCGKILCNGHHRAQKISRLAGEELKKLWSIRNE